MTDTEILQALREDIGRLRDSLERHTEEGSTRWAELQRELAGLAALSHATPCKPMEKRVTDLERDQNQAKGGMRVGLILVALFSAITGGIASLIAIFK